jgi:hypothetical protein
MIIVAAEISVESLDTANLAPMVQTAIGELEAVGVTETPGVVLADAGYWKNDAIEMLSAQGIPTLVAPDADRRKEPRPGRRGGRYDFARRVLATDWGKQLYLKRQGSVEPVFGQITSTAAPTASSAADDQPSDRNGGCLPRPTTSSSSTDTNSPPPDRRRQQRPGRASPTRLNRLAPRPPFAATAGTRRTHHTFPRHPPRRAAAPGHVPMVGVRSGA